MLTSVTRGWLLVPALCAACAAFPFPLPLPLDGLNDQQGYSSSVFHVPSSHQTVVTLSESRINHAPIQEKNEPPSPYKFEYKVHDEKSQNYHGRTETSDGKVVHGFYSLMEPHGELRIVKYRADHEGFQTEVSRHGGGRGGEGGGGRHGAGGGGGGDATHGGGLGATIGKGSSPASSSSSSVKLVSHSVTTLHESAPAPSPTHQHHPHSLALQHTALQHTPSHPAPQHVGVKEAIPIHEDHEEGNSWSVIDNPGHGHVQVQQQQQQHKTPDSEFQPIQPDIGEEVGGPGKRVPEQILLQQQKKAALQFQQQHKHQKPALSPHPSKHSTHPLPAKQPPKPFRRPSPPHLGAPRHPPHPPPPRRHHPLFHRGPKPPHKGPLHKRGARIGLAPSASASSGGPAALAPELGPAPGPIGPAGPALRREARPPPTPCQCGDPLHHEARKLP